MLEDARAIADGAVLDCDVAVVGAGAAGIAFAREFVDGALRLCLLEAGGLEIDGAGQALYEGDNVGLPYFDLALCRLRYFGGTTNHWGGYCTPFDASSFEQRPWIPDSGWPLTLRDLVPWYARANVLLGLDGQTWDVAWWQERLQQTGLPFDERRLATDLFLINPVRFGAVHADELRSAERVRVLLNANVVGIETTAAGDAVSGVAVRTLAGPGFRVGARTVVLAAGGIENARLLLLSGGLGNRHDLVGRYFADHAYLVGGVIQPASPGVDLRFYRQQPVDGHEIRARLKLAERQLREEQLVPVAIALEPLPDPATRSAGARSLRTLLRSLRGGDLPAGLASHLANVMADLGDLTSLAARRLWHGRMPTDRIECAVGLAPAPNPASRVLLGDETDALGLPRVKLDWRLSEIDRRSARRALETLATECGRIGLGRMQVQLDRDDRSWPDNLEGSYHHMGTTRMADDPRKGVVDRDCRVHGTRNLYVAGSSVFPTYGLGSPTQLLIALALRLADHLKQEL